MFPTAVPSHNANCLEIYRHTNCCLETDGIPNVSRKINKEEKREKMYMTYNVK